MNIIAEHDFIMKMHIIESIDRLMETVTLEDLSVTAICAEAQISRPTFYKYFSDKYAVAQWHFDFIAEDKLYQTGRTLTWFEANFENSRELENFRHFYTGVFQKRRGYQSLTAHCMRRRRETLIETITDFQKVPLTELLTFQVDYLVEAEVNAINKWACNGMPFSAYHMAELLDATTPRPLYDVLNTPVNPRH